MRCLKWVSMLTILAMLFAMLPATVAEDEIVLDGEEAVGGEMELELEEGELEVPETFDDPELSLEDTNLELDGLADNLLVPETEEQAEAPAAANASGDFVIDEEGVLTAYKGFDKRIIIPDGVKEIGESVFEDDKNMESITIPNTVTYIGWYAFKGCTNLKSITIPDSVISTGSGVFWHCSSLKNVQLSHNLNKIHEYMFCGCESIQKFEIPNNIKSIGENAFFLAQN